MNTKVTKPRGMIDVLPSNENINIDIPDISLWQNLEHILHNLATTYGYKEIRTSLFEKISLFQHSLGSSSDVVVNKEMFTFGGSNNEELALRPEGTAGCVRALLEYNLIRQGSNKLWYLGPMFRRERPQRGRYRLFYQFGIESFGNPEPEVEAEHLSMINRLWQELGLTNITLDINSIGSKAEREKYNQVLRTYWQQHSHQLSPELLERATINPLRILDSKDPKLQPLIAKAPTIQEFLSPEDREHFTRLQHLLDDLNIKYQVNHKIVRGLDYYNRTVYEWLTTDLGAQSAVGAGGRYDDLSVSLGGTKLPAVGFSLGLERVLLLLQNNNWAPTKLYTSAYFITAGSAFPHKLLLAEKIRTQCPKLQVLMADANINLKSHLQKADKSMAELALIVADNEFHDQTINIKYLRANKPQITVPLSDLYRYVNL